jgi:DNA-cytosine methyltransferase
MNVLSLFDGISCGRVALERAGIKVDKYFASEIDKSAISITQKNYPDTIQLGDVTNWQSWDLPKIDLILAGSPCQGFSIAGKQLNFDDPRSALFFTFLDILRAYKPQHYLLENVKMKKEWEDVITEHLGQVPVTIDSADFSAQRRKRVYWCTMLPLAKYEPCQFTVDSVLDAVVDDKYLIEPNRAVTILENEVRRRKIAYIGADSQGNRIYDIHGKSVTLVGQAGGLGAKTGIYALPCITPDRLTKNQNGRRFKPPNSKFYTLTAQDQHGIWTNHFIRKLTPVECERLQTLDDNYTEGISDNQRYKALGNGWTVDVIAHILKGINHE